MKANELRLGNYVEMTGVVMHLDHPEKLAYILENGFEVPCEPIPVTGEWLVKLGLKDEVSAVGEDFYHIYPSVDEDFNDIFIFSKNNERLREIKYVHELQNGWHWFTGEELTIKETENGTI